MTVLIPPAASPSAPDTVRADAQQRARLISKAQAHADLDTLAQVIRTRSSYALSVSFPVQGAIDALKSALPDDVKVADLAVAVQKLMQEIGDAHAKVVDFERYLPSGYLPVALGVDGRRHFAYCPARRALFAPDFPYLQAIDGVALTRWLECAGALVAGHYGSASSKLVRALPLLRHVQFLRQQLGLPASDDVALELVSADGLHTQVQRVPVAAQLEHTDKPFYLDQASRLLDGNVGYLRIHSQTDSALTASIPAAMADFADTDALIIDH